MSDVNESLDSMMSDIKVHLSDVIKVLESKNFLNSCIDKLKDLNSKEQTLEIVSDEDESLKIAGKKASSDSRGIYMFWADFSKWGEIEQDLKKKITNFGSQWNAGFTDNDAAKSKFPKFNKERMKNMIAEADINAIPFYLGKSKELAKRIEEHLNLKATSTTYALKLKARAEFSKGIKFKVAWLPLDVSDDEYFVVGKIESLLRDKLNPIIGKQ